jgi:hypothetical protein
MPSNSLANKVNSTRDTAEEFNEIEFNYLNVFNELDVFNVYIQ